jgi:hypothetical protein
MIDFIKCYPEIHMSYSTSTPVVHVPFRLSFFERDIVGHLPRPVAHFI